MHLDEKKQEIYSRQIIMKDIGTEGQRKLTGASVLVVGCGGLGAPVLYYLTAMGIGHLGLCDGDTVSLTNLNRQILFTMDDIDRPKASIAMKRLLALNPDLKSTVYDKFLDIELAEAIIPDYDIIVDCLDNFKTRFIINDVCVKTSRPLVHAGVEEYYGQLMTIIPGKGPCLRCLFPNGIQDEEKEKNSGVIGPTPGVIGAMQALEVIKYLLGMQTSNDCLVIYDGLELSTDKIKVQPSSGCICRKYDHAVS